MANRCTRIFDAGGQQNMCCSMSLLSVVSDGVQTALWPLRIADFLIAGSRSTCTQHNLQLKSLALRNQKDRQRCPAESTILVADTLTPLAPKEVVRVGLPGV